MTYYVIFRRCTALLTNCRGHGLRSKISSANSCTRATQFNVSSIKYPAKIQDEFRSLKKVSDKDVCIKKDKKIGHGVFGNCYAGSLGPLQVCAKVFRIACLCETAFCYEAVLLSVCCHANLPWLYGICLSPRTIIQSYHSIEGRACSLHKALYHSGRNFSSDNWMSILLGMASAVEYIHSKGILHNDIKSDNIVLDSRQSDVVHNILIDFRKGCFIRDARLYKLTADEKRIYVRDHPQVAPEVREGHQKQNKYSDMYSLGRVINKVNEKTLQLPDLSSYSCLCTQDRYSERPTSSDLLKFLSSLHV